ncbi:DsbA family protein [Aromatoleum toluolicum]|uniref:Thioredoxin domain-containing protein n=1 Tax=Aromatoleum toluolicum TaxID=90060 RepID=A0ABX1NGZ6_9RHOO|nr:thioredoxin domain-containing protein [Aromatoleum toluolicum]NMF98455.1 DsbA family protein [Aromatoleum toluolicum]
MTLAASTGLKFLVRPADDTAAVDPRIDRQETQETQRIEANRSALIRMHAPTLGKADAPVIIVEFLDPACETCRAFYPRVKEMMAANPDKIRLVLRYAPFHNGSDKIVAVLEAARRQGKFWPALEALLASQDEWAPHHTPQLGLVWKHLEQLGLDLERMALDMTSPEIAKVIEQDLADARTLNVTKTPEFFVNGKPLPSFGYEQLRSLVDAALSEARAR